MNVIKPESFARRSQTYHLHPAIRYETRAEAALVAEYSEQDSLQQLQECALLDLSELSRFGLRGPKAETVLGKEGLPFPSAVNQAQSGEQGSLVARLGKTECWVLQDPLAGTPEPGMLDIRATNESGCYPLYCQDSHAWFALTGRHLPELMAKLCGVDLRPDSFPPGAVVQSSVARVSAIIIHHELKGVPVFYLLSDSSSAEYLWHALQDAMQEYSGQPSGVAAFG